jgi:hypothetical protein
MLGFEGEQRCERGRGRKGGGLEDWGGRRCVRSMGNVKGGGGKKKEKKVRKGEREERDVLSNEEEREERSVVKTTVDFLASSSLRFSRLL